MKVQDWIRYDNLKQKEAIVKPEELLTKTPTQYIQRKNLMKVIWLDQRMVVYYELLKPNETIIVTRY